MWPPVPLGGCLATRLPDLEGTRGVERSHHWSLTPHPWALARTACQSFPVKSIGISAIPYRNCYRPRPGGFAGWDAGAESEAFLRTHLGHRREADSCQNGDPIPGWRGHHWRTGFLMAELADVAVIGAGVVGLGVAR